MAYAVPEDCQPLVGSLSGRSALVCGNGRGVFAEIDHALAHTNQPVIFAANDIGIALPTLHHWVSLHADNFPEWRRQRLAKGWDETFVTHTGGSTQFAATYNWTGMTPPHFSLSGLFAMQLAFIMGASPIILCGCPGEAGPRWNGTINETPGFGYGSGTSNTDAALRGDLDRQMAHMPAFKAAVRSMSGATQTYFGGP